MDDIQALYAPIQAAAEADRAWSAQQAEKAMAWQERMSDTAHQREVKDLIAAGLNPVLAAGGQGAAVGTGHAAQSSSAGVNALYGLISKAFDAQLKQAEALETTAKKVETPVDKGTGGSKGTEAPVGQLTTPKETMTKKERFDRDKVLYDTKTAYKLAETEDPWLREKIVHEAGYGDEQYKKDKDVKDTVAQAASSIISKVSFGYIDKTTAKKAIKKLFDWVEQPIEKLSGEMDKLYQKGTMKDVDQWILKHALDATGQTRYVKKKGPGSKSVSEKGYSGRKGKF